ncbi:MAG: 2-oxoacid:ferredoxin oxidoreductase subunit gamma [Eubacteriaceae bacterium]|nr:2-oxoacid:ferredoxin oxidoreductase subunit gamma [Eubacteriaceae bacterium]
MENTYIFAGSGGQGVQTLGQLMVYAAHDANKFTTYLPAYGGEMRGGASNCTVKISDEEIGAPAAKIYDNVVVFNYLSYTLFKDKTAPGGNLFVNTSLISDPTAPEGVNLIPIAINELTEQAGSATAANVVMFGFVNAYVGDIPLDTAKAVMLKKMEHKKEYLEINSKAFDLGVEAAKNFKAR